jgi:hypothetical protein
MKRSIRLHIGCAVLSLPFLSAGTTHAANAIVELPLNAKYDLKRDGNALLVRTGVAVKIVTLNGVSVSIDATGAKGELAYRLVSTPGGLMEYVVTPSPNPSETFRLVATATNQSVDSIKAASAASAADRPQPLEGDLLQKETSTTAEKAMKKIGDGKLSDYQVDLPMSASPALIALGGSGSAIPAVNTPREFVSQLARTVDADGKIKPGVSAEISLSRFLNRETLTLKSFSENSVDRWLANTTLSFATSAAGNKNGDFALGLQTTWIDQLDPAANPEHLVACFKAKLKAQIPLAPATIVVSPDGSAVTPDLVAFEKAKGDSSFVKPCFVEYSRRSGFKAATGIGYALASEERAVIGLKRGASAYWATLGYRYGRAASDGGSRPLGIPILDATLHVRWHRDLIVADPTSSGKFVPSDVRVLGAKLRFSNDKQTLSGLLEYSKTKDSIAGFTDASVSRRVAGIEFRIAKDLWFYFGSGNESGRRDGKNSRFGLANLKFGSASAPMFQP